MRGTTVADHYALSRSAELTSLAAFRGLIDAACGEHPEVDAETCYDLKLAVDEACTIVLTHG